MKIKHIELIVYANTPIEMAFKKANRELSIKLLDDLYKLRKEYI